MAHSGRLQLFTFNDTNRFVLCDINDQIDI